MKCIQPVNHVNVLISFLSDKNILTCKDMIRILAIPAIMLLLSVFYQPDRYEKKRLDMVSTQIRARGISDSSILKAMRKVPRHLFVPSELALLAYDDTPLPIGYEQTISQPFIVAWMTELVQPSPNKKALEIGTGSGYQAAILGETVGSVYTIEIVPELARSSAALLQKLGYRNITVMEGDGYQGWSSHAPFDIIMVTAACNHVPAPLLEQLAENGRLVIPVGEPGTIQELVLITKRKGRIYRQTITSVRFVPLTRKKKVV